MAELIDREPIIKKVKVQAEYSWNDTRKQAYKEFLDMLVDTPTTTEAEIRAKVIEEFASALANKDNLTDTRLGFVFEVSDSYDLSCDYLRRYIDEIAEQMKEVE